MLAGEGAEENGELSDELFVFEDVIGDAPRIDGGVVEEFEPIFRALLEAECLCPSAECFLITRRSEHFAFDLAPVARVVAVLEANFAQAQALSFPDLFYELAKHSVDFILWFYIYHRHQRKASDGLVFGTHETNRTFGRKGGSG